MAKGIRLSKKHGVNPCIPVCAWCGKEKNEVALLGYIKGDVEAPKNAVINYEPCDECKKAWSRGVVVIEVVPDPEVEGQREFVEGAYPTGRWVVVKEGVLDEEHHAGDIMLAWAKEFKMLFQA